MHIHIQPVNSAPNLTLSHLTLLYEKKLKFYLASCLVPSMWSFVNRWCRGCVPRTLHSLVDLHGIYYYIILLKMYPHQLQNKMSLLYISFVSMVWIFMSASLETGSMYMRNLYCFFPMFQRMLHQIKDRSIFDTLRNVEFYWYNVIFILFGFALFSFYRLGHTRLFTFGPHDAY
jgi:hypothetical protein